MIASSSSDRDVDFGSLGQVGRRLAFLPLGDGLLVDAMALGQGPQALLTMLYRSTDCLCRCGAAVKNLAHSASFQSLENNAPSNPGIKHCALDESNNVLLDTTWPPNFTHSHAKFPLELR